MKKKMILFALCFMCVGLCACGTKYDNAGSQQTPSSSATENEQTSKPTEAAQPTQTNDTLTEPTEVSQSDKTEAIQSDKTEESSVEQSESEAEAITEEQALNAIKNYCFTKDPNLENMAKSDEYTIYWDATTNEDNKIVVLYRAYTGAQIRYYIDPVSGEAYVTELVPGIIDEEQRSDETLNVRDYLA